MSPDRLIRHLSTGLCSTVSLVERGGAVLVRKGVSSRAKGLSEAREQIWTEGELLVRLPRGIAPTLEAAEEDESGPFILMEYIPWPSLADVRPKPGSVSGFLDDALRAALDVMAALHSAGDDKGPLSIVHADVSPSNLLFDATSGRVVILDFGLALSRLSTAGRTPGGAFRGTFMYTAPEGARGEPIDARADLFSLAASVLHAALGVPPRKGATRAALLVEAGETPPDAWLALARTVASPAAFSVLAACLEFDRDRRPASAAAALAALTRG